MYMGSYLNIGSGEFQECVSSEIYVDKSLFSNFHECWFRGDAKLRHGIQNCGKTIEGSI